MIVIGIGGRPVIIICVNASFIGNEFTRVESFVKSSSVNNWLKGRANLSFGRDMVILEILEVDASFPCKYMPVGWI
jgi:hypothetical protein